MPWAEFLTGIPTTSVTVRVCRILAIVRAGALILALSSGPHAEACHRLVVFRPVPDPDVSERLQLQSRGGERDELLARGQPT